MKYMTNYFSEQKYRFLVVHLWPHKNKVLLFSHKSISRFLKNISLYELQDHKSSNLLINILTNREGKCRWIETFHDLSLTTLYFQDLGHIQSYFAWKVHLKSLITYFSSLSITPFTQDSLWIIQLTQGEIHCQFVAKVEKSFSVWPWIASSSRPGDLGT